jgi:glycerol-3-phosphate dehydrogenase (NAD(P)+)
MAILTVLGAGMMGSSLCIPLVDRGHDVRLVGTHLDAEIVHSLKRDHTHPKLKLELPQAIRPFYLEELDAAMAGADAILLGVSSAGVTWAGTAIAPHVTNERPILMVSKGLGFEGGRLRVLPDVLRDALPPGKADGVHPAAVAGPCIAGELARRVDTCVVFTGRNQPELDRLKAWIGGGYYHVFTSTDVVGVEACAALKNAYAMGIAFASGLHAKAGGEPGSIANHNYEAAVFAQAIVEMQLLVKVIGGSPNSAVGLPGVGDLNVTCNGGRTGRFGRLLGMGLGVQESIRRMEGATLECLEILTVLERALPALKAAGSVRDEQLPLLEHMIGVALHDAPVAMPFDAFQPTSYLS